MVTRRALLLGGAAIGAVAIAGVLIRDRNQLAAATASAPQGAETFEVTHTEDEWRKLLTSDQFSVLRKEGTERPFTSALLDEHRKGTFICAGCALPLFSSDTKFDSGTGWPSFWKPLDNAVGQTRDTTFGMVRTAVHCHRCGGHLGHVFTDGPPPTGLRYCMNGVALNFTPAIA